jgi:hypothetical protein
VKKFMMLHMDAAMEIARACPFISSVRVYEMRDM